MLAATDKLPPNSLEGELGVLGCVLCATYNDESWAVLDECIEKLKGPKAFYHLKHRQIYETMLEIKAEGKQIDLTTLSQRLKDKNLLERVGGLGFLSSLPDHTPSAANLEYYLDLVREKHLLRILIYHCTKTIEAAQTRPQEVQAILDQHEKSVCEIRTDKEISGASVADAREASLRLIDFVEKRFNLGGRKSGLVTGFPHFDNLTDGLQAGEQVIIAARPSAGKTALGMNIVQKVCLEDENPTLIVSCEMSIPALMRRLLASWARIPLYNLKTGKLHEDEMERWKSFSVLINKKPLFFIEAITGANSDRLAAAIRRMHRQHSFKLVLVDYLQKIQASRKQEKRTYEVGEVSGTLKALAVETKAAFLTLAQLSREPEKDKGRPPRLSDLADSAQIERDADLVALIERVKTEQDPHGRQAKLHIAKQRDGEVGTVQLVFEAEYGRFRGELPSDP